MTILCVERKTIVEKLDILDFGNSKLNVELMISEINKNGSDLLILGSKRQKTGVDLLTLGAITMPGTHPWLQVHQKPSVIFHFDFPIHLDPFPH